MLRLQKLRRQRTRRNVSLTMKMVGIGLASLIRFSDSASYAQMVPDSSPDWRSEVNVDLSNTSGVEDGSSTHPYNTIAEGTAAANGGTVWIRPGSYREVLIVNQPMTLHSTGGIVTIGRSLSPPGNKIYLPLVLMDFDNQPR